MSKMTNNPDRPTKSEDDQNLRTHTPAQIDNNSELMTEAELVRFLRVPEISKAGNYHNVIENLKRMHDLPRVHICGKPLYPLEAIRQWIKEKTIFGK